jgi:hypothetical protein
MRMMNRVDCLKKGGGIDWARDKTRELWTAVNNQREGGKREREREREGERGLRGNVMTLLLLLLKRRLSKKGREEEGGGIVQERRDSDMTR